MATGSAARWMLAGTAFVLAASCGTGASESPPTTVLTTTTTPTSTPTVPVASTSNSTTTRPSSLPEFPDLLLAHANGISQVGAGTMWLSAGPVGVAFPDHRGGVVFQRDAGADGSFPIEYLAAPGAEPALLIDVASGDRIALLDVFELNDAVTVAYTQAARLPNDCAAADVECLWQYDITYLLLYDLAAGTGTNLGAIGSFESSWSGYRFAAGRFASVWTEYGESTSCLGFGEVQELLVGASADRWLAAGRWCRVDPGQDCPDGSTLCASTVRAAVSPQGSLIALASGEVPAPIRIDVLDTTPGAVIRHVEVPGIKGFPIWMEFDGTWIIVGFQSHTGEEIPTMIVRPDGVTDWLEVVGRVSFWSAP